MANAFKNHGKNLTDATLTTVFTASIPADSTMVFADVKLNVENTDLLRAQSSHASGNLTVFCSTLEIT
jgi:hypothetical protein